MHFKAIANKDNSLASIVQCDDTFTADGKRIYYIEADSKEMAVKKFVAMMAAKLDKYNAQTRIRATARIEERKTNHKCQGCAVKMPKYYAAQSCAACLARKGKRQRERYAGAPLENTKSRTPEEKAAVMVRRLENNRIYAKAVGDTRAGAKRVALASALAEFDRRTPAGFRRWLVNEIARFSPHLAPKADEAEPVAAE